jgi:hypothetical protein
MVLAATPVLAAEAPLASCEQIRSQIGVAPVADADLLRSLAARRECGFTAREVYRAAHGDRPWPRSEVREPRPDRNNHDAPDDHSDHRHDDD